MRSPAQPPRPRRVWLPKAWRLRQLLPIAAPPWHVVPGVDGRTAQHMPALRPRPATQHTQHTASHSVTRHTAHACIAAAPPCMGHAQLTLDSPVLARPRTEAVFALEILHSGDTHPSLHSHPCSPVPALPLLHSQGHAAQCVQLLHPLHCTQHKTRAVFP